jgi:hypothetical protein
MTGSLALRTEPSGTASPARVRCRELTTNGGPVAEKSPQKKNGLKPGKSLKEKRSDKAAKKASKGSSSR